MGDTLFGQLCWAIRHRYGEDFLITLLEKKSLPISAIDIKLLFHCVSYKSKKLIEYLLKNEVIPIEDIKGTLSEIKETFGSEVFFSPDGGFVTKMIKYSDFRKYAFGIIKQHIRDMKYAYGPKILFVGDSFMCACRRLYYLNEEFKTKTGEIEYPEEVHLIERLLKEAKANYKAGK